MLLNSKSALVHYVKPGRGMSSGVAPGYKEARERPSPAAFAASAASEM